MEIGDEVIHFTGKPAMVTGKITRSSEILEISYMSNDALVFAKVDPKEIKPADDKSFGFKKE